MGWRAEFARRFNYRIRLRPRGYYHPTHPLCAAPPEGRA
jgi:hypothetical protein